MPTLHARQLLDVLRKFTAYPKRFGDVGDGFFTTQHWNEVFQQQDGTIRRETQYPKTPGDLIVSGPHFSVAKPLHQTPKQVCETHRAYDLLNLEELPDDYLPRTNYIPACGESEYIRRTPTVGWGKRERVSQFCRIVFRAMLSQAGERTLIPSLIPANWAHINGAISIAFKEIPTLIDAAAVSASLAADFFIKTTGSSNLHLKWTSLPWLDATAPLAARTLTLNCLTTHYTELWRECWDEAFRKETWLGDDPRLDADFWRNLTPEWTRHSALRTDFARRWALVELDVLAARALALTLAELQTIYRIQFPVMRQYEADTWYDQCGRIIFTNSKGLPGVGLPRAEWNEVRALQSGTVKRTVTDTTLPTGPIEREIIYHAPFTKCDRETDYATVWRNLEQREMKS